MEIENGMSTNNKNNTSFRAEEPPPDPEDFETKKEEEEHEKLMQRLYENQKKRREMVSKLEKENELKKELEDQKKLKELLDQKPFYVKRNMNAKMRAMVNNEKIKFMLDKVDDYMRQIKNLDAIDKIKAQAQKEFELEIANQKKNKRKLSKNELEKLSKLNNVNEQLKNENKEKIKKRKLDEELKKKKLENAKKANERAQEILKNGYKLPKGGNTSNDDANINIRSGGLGIFQEENIMGGTELMPGMENKIKNRPKSSTKIKNNNNNIKFGMTMMPNKIEENPEEELAKILKKNKYDLSELLKFQKKYKYYNISNYIHAAQMKQIQNTKNKKKKNIVVNNNNNVNINNNKFGFEMENEQMADNNANNFGNEENNIQNNNRNINSYLQACKYNNEKIIQTILLNAKNDEEVFKIVNEKDDFGRNGLMYLLIHNNKNMIKLSLLSGVILDNSTDIYGRNLVHYCCTENVDKSMLDIICHCIDFKNFYDLCKYVNKCISLEKIDEINKNSNEYKSECENKINDFDNLIEEKDKKLDIKKLNNFSRNNTYITKMVNSPDIEGNYPIHYLAQKDDMDKMEVLLYYNTKLDVLDGQGKKPIDITDNEVIQQFLLKNEKNINSKNELYGIKNNNINNSKQAFNNSNISGYLNITTSALDMEKIKFYSPEKINSFVSGVEGNTYLILSVIQQNYDAFKFLLEDKKAKADHINGNGWTVIFFIILKKLWIFFAYLFKLPNPDSCDTTEKNYNELIKIKKYKKVDLMKPNGELTYLGQSIKVMDNLSKKNNNLLSLCVEELNDLFLLKSLYILYENYVFYFSMNQPQDVVFSRQYGKYDESSYMNIVYNRQYGKNKETILIKCVKNKNLEMLKYLLVDLYRNENKIEFDINKSDYKTENILHHAVLLKQKEIIKFLIKYDSEDNILKTSKNNKGKTPSDLDRCKQYKNEFITIWEAAEENNIDLLNLLINDLKYYEINDQKYISKDTALHSAVKKKADRSVLFLLKAGANKKLKNKNGKTAYDLIDVEEKHVKKDKKWINKAEKIFNGVI